VGRFSYPAVVRLFAVADAYWSDIDGSGAWKGIDPLSLSVHRFLNLIQFWLVKNADADERDRILLAIYAEAEGTDPDRVPQSVVDEEMSMFMAFASQNKALGGES
jgi:hypothetical protein